MVGMSSQQPSLLVPTGGRKREDKVLRFFSGNFGDKGIIEVPLENLHFEKEHNWTNYPKGVLHFLQEAGHVIDSGMDVYVYGNIPNGSGLSSSASLELLDWRHRRETI